MNQVLVLFMEMLILVVRWLLVETFKLEERTLKVKSLFGNFGEENVKRRRTQVMMSMPPKRRHGT